MPSVSRRHFLTAATAMTGLAVLPSIAGGAEAAAPDAPAAAPPRPASASDLPKEVFQHGFAIGVQSYIFRDVSAYEAVELAALAGCSVIEFAFDRLSPQDQTKPGPGMRDAQINDLLAHLAKHKIKAAGMYTDIPADEAAARPLFAFAKKMGFYNLVTESVAAIDVIDTLVKEFDLHVGYHEHQRTDNANYKLWDPQFVLNLVKDRDPRIGACGDVGHWASSGIRPLEAIQRLKGRMISLHLKDRAEIGKATTDLANAGSGVLEFAAILKELRAQGFKGQISIEYEDQLGHNMPAVSQYVGFVRGVGAAL